MLKRFFYIIVILAAIFFSLVGPLDRAPLKEKSYYISMMKKLDTLHIESFDSTDTTRVGWSKVSLIPDHNMPMAGYSPRDSFKQVHDTLYARILSINNGSEQVYMISMDLLIVPPVIKNSILEQLSEKDKDAFVYFSSTHTHNGPGGWQNSIGGKLAVGSYDEAWIDKTSTDIVAGMIRAKKNMQKTKLDYIEVNADEFVRNRLANDEGTKDGKIRGLSFEQNNGKKAILFTYSAHATSISSSSRSLSGDYPAEVIKDLNVAGWDCPMFMSGMVGSHALSNIEGEDYELIKNTGAVLSKKIINASHIPLNNNLSIKAKHIQIELGPSQLRIFDNWKVRDWAFRLLLFGKLHAEITYLKIGDVLFLGAPCDFSGELSINNKFDSLAVRANEHLIITSFNGDYTGYITEDSHYDHFSQKEEVRAMNWVGPYHGRYYSEIIERLINK